MAGPAQYVHLGFLLISFANLMVIALLIVVFALAVMLRRPAKQRLSTIEATLESGGAVNDGNRRVLGKEGRS